MSIILTLISLVIILLGAMMIYRPRSVPDTVELYIDDLALQVYASVGRILLGTAFMVYADHSRLPLILYILGLIAILSGLFFMFMQPEKFRDLARSMLEKVRALGIWPGVVVLVIGLIVLYAVW